MQIYSYIFNVFVQNVVLERVQHELKHITAAEMTWCEELDSLKSVHSDLLQTQTAAEQMLQDQEERRTHLVQNNRHLGWGFSLC